MRLDEIKKGFWGYRMDGVYQYVAAMEEEFSGKLLEKDNQMKETVARVREEATRAAEQMKRDAEELAEKAERMRQEAEYLSAEAKRVTEEAEERARRDMEDQLAQVRQEAEERLAQAKRDTEEQAARARREAEEQVAQVRREAEEQAAQVRQEAEAQLAQAKRDAGVQAAQGDPAELEQAQRRLNKLSAALRTAEKENESLLRQPQTYDFSTAAFEAQRYAQQLRTETMELEQKVRSGLQAEVDRKRQELSEFSGKVGRLKRELSAMLLEMHDQLSGLEQDCERAGEEVPSTKVVPFPPAGVSQKPTYIKKAEQRDRPS